MPHTLTVALAQTKQTNDIGGNLRQIARTMAQARDEGVALLCFAETALTGYGPFYHESAAAFDPDAVLAAVEEVRGLARDARMALIIGAHLPLESGWTNSLLAITPQGRIAGQYDKLHLYARDIEYYRAGRALPRVVTLAGVKIGMQMCFDSRYPETFRLLAAAGAQVLIVPSHIHGKGDMWKGPVYRGHMISRAAENGRFVLFINASGPQQNVPTMIVNPRGDVIAECRLRAPTLLVQRLNLGEVNDLYLGARRSDLYEISAAKKR